MDAASSRVVRGRVVTPEAVLDDGAVAVDGAHIAWVGRATEAPAAWRRAVAASPPAPGEHVLPGLVDLHCHGGGGAGFPDAEDRATARVAVAEHLRHGTTSLVASLVTAAPDVLRRRTRLLAAMAEDGEIAGIHLEGPFLAATRCGAQDPTEVRPPDVALSAELLALARGHLVTMTLAPELPGAVGPGGVTEVLVAGGALPSFGHTAASGAQVRQAVTEAAQLLGATRQARSARPTVTHLFNAMAPLHHREPGPVLELLAAARRGTAVVELVADGVHLDPGLVRNVLEIAGSQNVALVTDAMAAAGRPDGDYRLGGRAVTVRGGVARLAGDAAQHGDLAGGTGHLIDLVRSCVAAGVRLGDAVHAAATTPAAVLGDAGIGALEVGRRADLLRTDHELNPIETMREGRTV